ncbi:dicarboxylate/amino acid:cation symporter [Legionella longbeachae]|uniref:Putative sodium:dicarboxylate symporter protein n=1 Tax=Legionella longbeachae serogroup 1 (strain NSW150) TaxID=661367 RepID=D3HL79_LEGLN|nr:dicarboxylate/amino acid:cation symporter [Legionella longbeachae]VEE03704.1 sodium:dicarboxylate symporter protein [Legionella oakridgensis]HBD7397491.1 dicarboxylate/amino acid:cation symporter [Legionella pneumophila]ARB93413.1 dicarboxylate/amino acid:cation symporter [Legionella longbeachae]ARM33481.1 dicarboxylate/amino acid:cation symporter [Legionella longbeachae]EEZ93667.1 putative proton/sodium-glutamate symport protein [Legionella longbeachae D-4968]
MAEAKKVSESYLFSLILISAILLGGLTGCFSSKITHYLKPFGDIFLNLIFTAIVPLIFFSVSSAIARIGSMGKLSKIAFYMTMTFLFTGIIAAIYALFVVHIFPPAQNVVLPLTAPVKTSTLSFIDQIPEIFTVSEFSHLLSHKHILALIVFSIFVGLATSHTHEKAKPFSDFLQAGEEIFMRVFTLIMYYAPFGFFAYFAVLVHDLGPQLMTNYLRVGILYYSFGVLYFILINTFFAYLAGKTWGIRLFWRNIFLPAVTSIATCSSAASIPANLISVKNMKVAPEIYETVIPLGTIIHKDGSVIGGVFKIAFLFGIFHLNFSEPSVLLTALGVSLMVGTVMGAIPSGGMLGELLILSVYGFPPSVLMIIAAISIIIDPLATMLNVTCNSVSCMIIARFVEGKKWFTHSTSR